jgi:pimeloyl-ACP methyl ester carboxylesterase
MGMLSGVPLAPANGIQLFYDEIGDAGADPMLMIMGLGTQMIAWDEDFCRLLADMGFRVIRFDNRDCGLSTKMTGAPPPNFAAGLVGDFSTATYGLEDLADDAFGLLDHLGIDAAHVVGASMGGMIAQLMAIDRPDRVRTLCSMLSSTGSPWVGQPHPEALELLMRPGPRNREEAIEMALVGERTIGTRDPALQRSDEEIRRRAGIGYDRSSYGPGAGRQLMAIIIASDRTERLRRLKVPTLVIHGEIDPLIDVSGGRATAEAVPDAELLVFPDVGHDLPRQLWPATVEAIAANASRAHAERT